MIKAVTEFIARALMILAALGLVLIALMIGADVISRLFRGAALVGVAEVVAQVLLITAFLQLPYTVLSGGMLRAELMDNRGPLWLQRLLELFRHSAGALFFGLIAYYSWTPMMRSYLRGTFEGHASLRVPQFPARAIIVICSALAVLIFIGLAIQVVQRMVAQRQVASEEV